MSLSTPIVGCRAALYVASMRRRYVSVPFELRPEDIPAATELLAQAVPIVFDALGFDETSRLKIQALLRSDLIYLEPFLLEPSSRRPAMTVSRLAKGANIARSNVYTHSGDLATKAQRCALALTMLLAARGDFCDASMWMVCELDSRVGRGSTSPGRVGSRQRLWGIALVGGDVMLPAFLAAPADEMDETRLAKALNHMLRELSRVAERLRSYASTPAANGRLEVLGLTADDLLAYTAMNTILVPELHLRPGPRPWLGPIALPRETAQTLVDDHGFGHAIVEISDDPYGCPAEWKHLSWKALAELAPYVAHADLDLGFKPSSASYFFRRDGTVLHRRQHPTSADGKQALANDLSYAISGFDLRNIESMGTAIAYIEFLATKTHIQQCGERYAEQLTPALLKAHEAEQRALVRALRMTRNSALVAVGRDRQARELDYS
jgi:hypothetical protein